MKGLLSMPEATVKLIESTWKWPVPYDQSTGSQTLKTWVGYRFTNISIKLGVAAIFTLCEKLWTLRLPKQMGKVTPVFRKSFLIYT